MVCLKLPRLTIEYSQELLGRNGCIIEDLLVNSTQSREQPRKFNFVPRTSFAVGQRYLPLSELLTRGDELRSRDDIEKQEMGIAKILLFIVRNEKQEVKEGLPRSPHSDSMWLFLV